MCSRNALSAPTFRRTPGLRVRPVPELGTCLVFTPSPPAPRPRLHRLNPTAWLLLEIASRAGGPEAREAEFLARVAPSLSEAEARKQLREGLAMLVDAGILEAEREHRP